MYPYDTDEDDDEETELNEDVRVSGITFTALTNLLTCSLQTTIPFAVVGSENNVIIDGKSVRGRKNRWGVVNVEDPTHCEFVNLRNFLTRYV